MSVPVARNSPELLVEIDFANDPTNATRVWTDVSPYVRQVSYTRDGRDNQLSRTTPGTLAATFDNRDSRFDSTNAGSPYYPGVKRKRWIRVSAVWAGTTYRRWTGLVETWRQDWPSAGKDATAEITATSALSVLNLFDLEGLSYGAQQTGTRVGAVLTDIGLTGFTVDTGITALPAVGPFAAGTTALSHLLEVEATENGLLYGEGDGTVHFQDRHWRLTNTAATTSQATIGDQVGELPYQSGTLDLDDSDLWNSVTVTPAGGAAQTWSDAASINAHYKRKLAISILSTSTAEALANAQYLVGRYKDTAPRIPSLTLLTVSAPTFWTTVLGAGNSYRFTWKRRAVNTISQDVFVERVSDVVAPGVDWRVSFQLSPAVDLAGWVAGKPGYSEAGLTTRAVY